MIIAMPWQQKTYFYTTNNGPGSIDIHLSESWYRVLKVANGEELIDFTPMVWPQGAASTYRIHYQFPLMTYGAISTIGASICESFTEAKNLVDIELKKLPIKIIDDKLTIML